MASNAMNAGALALGLSLVLGTGGCGNEAAPGQAEQEQGGLVGELSEVSVLDSPDRSSVYFLRPADRSSDVSLLFDSKPDLTPGTTIRVWGSRDGDALRVSRFEVVPPSASALINAPPQKAQTVAWVQIDINGGGVNQTKEAASALIFDQNAGPIFGTKAGNLSVVQYYAAASYGMLQLSGDVVGPIPFSGTACNNLGGVARDVDPKVDALGKTYNHYYLYWGSKQDCGPGWGDEGTHDRNGKNVYLNNDGTFCTATGQEIGHNFGLMHASTMDCGTSTMANATSTCTSSEYGNPMTVMGGGCRDLTAIEKWYSLFFGGCNAVRVKQSGTFTLFPLETACNGIQVLQIQFPSAAPARTTTTSQSNGAFALTHYYLELRSSVGVDTGIKPGVYVYAGPDIPASSKTGPRNVLLDMNPATSSFDAMTAGQTFMDPAGGLSFTVNSFDATKATITVEITGGSGGNTCVDGSTLSGSGPDSCGAPTTGAGGAGGGTGGTGAAGSSGGAGAGGRGGSTGTGTGGSIGGAGRGGSTGTGGSLGGAGGRGGSTGAGTGGNLGGTGGAGAGGRGGSTGTGTGGSIGGATGTGSGGRGGATGAAGTGAGGSVSGTGGVSGTGSGGSGVTTGTAGTGATGAAGNIGGTGTGGAGTTGSAGAGGDGPGEVGGGCSCDIGGAESAPLSGWALLIGVGALVARRRKVR